VDPMKAKAIATMKPSTTVKELKSFLGSFPISEDSSPVYYCNHCIYPIVEERCKV
jgi:hypothetical protein